MKGCKLVVSLPDGGKMWINPFQLMKMEKTADGRYLVYMSNGDSYQVDHKTASLVENCFEGRD